jgi:hypothetical protein
MPANTQIQPTPDPGRCPKCREINLLGVKNCVWCKTPIPQYHVQEMRTRRPLNKLAIGGAVLLVVMLVAGIVVFRPQSGEHIISDPMVDDVDAPPVVQPVRIATRPKAVIKKTVNVPQHIRPKPVLRSVQPQVVVAPPQRSVRAGSGTETYSQPPGAWGVDANNNYGDCQGLQEQLNEGTISYDFYVRHYQDIGCGSPTKNGVHVRGFPMLRRPANESFNDSSSQYRRSATPSGGTYQVTYRVSGYSRDVLLNYVLPTQPNISSVAHVSLPWSTSFTASEGASLSVGGVNRDNNASDSGVTYEILVNGRVAVSNQGDPAEMTLTREALSGHMANEYTGDKTALN